MRVNEKKPDFETAQLPSHYIFLTEKLELLYQQNTTNPSHQLTEKIITLEKEILTKYPDLVSIEDDVGRELSTPK